MITRERRLEMAVETLRGTVDGMRADLDRMKANHPPSKRGSRYTFALESLEMRLNGAAEEIEEALAHTETRAQPPSR